ncbi:carbonic anhydrase [Paraburkholderia oxyphila]|uniref:carbonic anhydrase n=1 Tax=Paraburkholderia oxyphila TaxID=614212 RepID=UPI0005BA2C61|nr:carbonic anhydrase [Paraburkholderia oxyphila]
MKQEDISNTLRAYVRRDLPQLLSGVERFRRDVFPSIQALFEQLAHGQAPHTLFITCADSRISPETITQSQPGELFVCRNIGNIVPPYGETLGAVSAVIEYAVLSLNVQQIVVCGHTDCGAMKSLAAEASPCCQMPNVHAWLRNAEAARSIVRTRSMSVRQTIQNMAEENVRLQIAHLRTHPAVAARLAQQRLALQGWVYDIGHGDIAVLDAQSDRFMALDAARERLVRKPRVAA